MTAMTIDKDNTGDDDGCVKILCHDMTKTTLVATVCKLSFMTTLTKTAVLRFPVKVSIIDNNYCVITVCHDYPDKSNIGNDEGCVNILCQRQY